MIISLAGKPGSGKSTVAEMLCKKLHLKRYYMGQLMRDIAKQRNITLEELNAINEKDPSVDKEVDKHVQNLGKTEDDFLIESRTAFYFIPNSIKVYLDVSLKSAAERIYKDTKIRNEKKYTSLKDLKKAIKERIKSEKKRYKKYYHFDPSSKKNYQIYINTSKFTADEVAEKIIKKINRVYHIKKY